MGEKLAQWIPLVILAITGIITVAQMNSSVVTITDRAAANLGDIRMLDKRLTKVASSQASNRAELARLETRLESMRLLDIAQHESVMRLLNTLEGKWERFGDRILDKMEVVE